MDASLRKHRVKAAWRWGLCLVLCAASAPLAAALPGEPAEARIRVLADSEPTAKAWERFAAACAADVTDLVGPGPEPQRLIRLYAGERRPGPEAEADPFSLAADPAEPLEAVTHRLVRALLRRRFLGPGERTPPPMPSSEWVAAALTNRILFGNRERYGCFAPDYEPARYAFQRGLFPDVARLVTHPVPPQRTVLFRLYALHADLLALCLEEGVGPGAVRRVLELDARDRTPVDAVSFVAQDAFEPGETLQTWYARTAPAVSRRGRRPSETATAAERFESLTTVSVVAPGERDFRGTRRPIEDVPEKLEALRRDTDAMGTLQRDLFELIKDAPFLLQAPIAGYADACRKVPPRGDIDSRAVRNARSAMRKAREAVADALARQRQLEEYLDEQERRHVPAGRRLGLFLDVVSRYRQADRELAPDLHAYLDSMARD